LRQLFGDFPLCSVRQTGSRRLLGSLLLVVLASPVVAQRQFDSLPLRALPPVRDLTLATATGDVDADGDVDVVFANDGQNRLLRNDGYGGYTEVTGARMPADTDRTAGASLSDVDRDGDLDLVLGNHGQNRLYLNDGTGAFADVTASHLPSGGDRSEALAVGDVDGDLDLDFVVANGARQQNRLYLNDGQGRFTEAAVGRFPVDADATLALALGDIDGDGDLDVALANSGQNRLYVNDGFGGFADLTAQRLPAHSDGSYAVAFGDLDRDGDLDLLIGNSFGQNRLYRNDGAGVFTDATAGRLPADIDLTHGVSLGDVDGDLDLDIVFASSRFLPGQGQNRLYLNDGSGLFADASAQLPAIAEDTQAIDLVDVDGDGDLDVISGNEMLRIGPTPFPRPNRLDFNDGRGNFADGTATALPFDEHNARALAVGDVDGDGDLDLLEGGMQERLLLNDGLGTYVDASAVQLPAITDDTLGVALGDIDGDGDLDFVTANRGQNRLYLNDGRGTFTDVTVAQLPAVTDESRGVALGDVDGDGDLDLITANDDGQQNRLYLNDGRGAFTDVTASRLPLAGESTSSLALGDVDGDADLDLVFGNDDDPDRLYLNQGGGLYRDASAGRMPTSLGITTCAALGDVEGDGDLDLVLGQPGQTRLYLNDGQARFSDVTSARLPADPDWPYGVALVDVDRDGDLDLFAANNNVSGIGLDRLYFNLRRQLHAPDLFQVGHPYELEVYRRYGPPSVLSFALPIFSTARASIPVLPFGILGLEPQGAVVFPPINIMEPAGIGTVPLFVPAVPALIGAPLYAQALVVPSPLPALLTNVEGGVARP